MNELTIVLKDGQPLYEQIYTFIKKAVISGEIPLKTKLPSTRTLALHLQVSRSTVNLAYEQLMSEGYIESIAGSGYYVAEIDGIIPGFSCSGMWGRANPFSPVVSPMRCLTGIFQC